MGLALYIILGSVASFFSFTLYKLNEKFLLANEMVFINANM